MIGKTFNRLTVARFSHYDKRHRKHFLCSCDCGKLKTVQMSLLKSGNTKSCGCLAVEARKKQLLPKDGGAVNQIILQYKRHAKDRNIAFLLSRSTVDTIVRQPCHYCGNPAGNLKRTKGCPDGFRHNGIDRIDSKKAYRKDNVVPCCGLCNKAKRNMSREVFLAWARQVAAYQDKLSHSNGDR